LCLSLTGNVDICSDAQQPFVAGLSTGAGCQDAALATVTH
jgi:hypothetical protein